MNRKNTKRRSTARTLEGSQESNLTEEDDEGSNSQQAILDLVPNRILFTTTAENDILTSDTSQSDKLSHKSNLTTPSMNSLDSLLLYPSTNNNFYFNRNNCSSPTSMYRSITSIASEEDPWRASSIGIKCISYKPVGYVFLTRRVLDLYTTDGKRKVDIVYNYSKKYRNRIKTPSIGSHIENCSFCDTITIDFDPSSTLFDLIMEVQIITQGAAFERSLKLSAVSRSGDDDQSVEIVPSDQMDCVANLSAESDNEDESFIETTTITSDYDFKYHKASGFVLNEQTSDFSRKQNEIECHKLTKTSGSAAASESSLEAGTQKIIVKTVIHSELDDSGSCDFNAHMIDANFCGTPDRSRTPDMNRGLSVMDKTNSRSQSTSCLLGPDYNRCKHSRLSDRRSNTPDRVLNNNSSNYSSNASLRSSSSRRSIITTVECIPADSNAIEAFDIEEEITEKEKFFGEFDNKYSTRPPSTAENNEVTSDHSMSNLSSNMSDMGSNNNLNESIDHVKESSPMPKSVKSILKLSCHDESDANFVTVREEQVSDKHLYDIDEKSESSVATPMDNVNTSSLFHSSDLLIETNIDLKSSLVLENTDKNEPSMSMEDVIRKYDKQMESRPSQENNNNNNNNTESVETVNFDIRLTAITDDEFQESTGSECSGSENIDFSLSEESTESMEMKEEETTENAQGNLSDLIKSLNKLSESLSRLSDDPEEEEVEKPKELELDQELLRKFNLVIDEFMDSSIEKIEEPAGGFSKEGSPNDIKPKTSVDNPDKEDYPVVTQIDSQTDEEKDFNGSKSCEKVILKFDSAKGVDSNQADIESDDPNSLFFCSFGPSTIQVVEEELDASSIKEDGLLSEESEVYHVTVEEGPLYVEEKPLTRELTTIESDEELLVPNERDDADNNPMESEVLERITLSFDSFNSSGEQLVGAVTGELIEETVEEDDLVQRTEPTESIADMEECNSNFKRLLFETDSSSESKGLDVNFESDLEGLSTVQEEDINDCSLVTSKVAKEDQELEDQINQETYRVQMIVEPNYNEKPEVVQEEPEVVQEKPEVVQEEPEVVQEKPEVVQEEPEVVQEEPEVVQEEPEVVQEEPEVVQEEPEVVQEEPEVVQEEMNPIFSFQLEIKPKYDDVLEIVLDENRTIERNILSEVTEEIVLEKIEDIGKDNDIKETVSIEKYPPKAEFIEDIIIDDPIKDEFQNLDLYDDKLDEAAIIKSEKSPSDLEHGTLFEEINSKHENNENKLDEANLLLNELVIKKPVEYAFPLNTEQINEIAQEIVDAFTNLNEKIDLAYDIEEALENTINDKIEEESVKESPIDSQDVTEEIDNDNVTENSISNPVYPPENEIDDTDVLEVSIGNQDVPESSIINEQVIEDAFDSADFFKGDTGDDEVHEAAKEVEDVPKMVEEKSKNLEREMIFTKTLEIEINEVESVNDEDFSQVCESSESMETYSLLQDRAICQKLHLLESAFENEFKQEHAKAADILPIDVPIRSEVNIEDVLLDIKVNNLPDIIELNAEVEDSQKSKLKERLVIPIKKDSHELEEVLENQTTTTRTTEPIERFVFSFMRHMPLKEPSNSLSESKIVVPSEEDINLLDQSRFQLALDIKTGNESQYFDLVSESSDPAYFPLYILNESLVKKVPVSVDIVERRQFSKAISPVSPAVFDIYTEWDQSYSSHYLESLANKADEEINAENSILGQNQSFQVPTFVRADKQLKKSNSQGFLNLLQFNSADKDKKRKSICDDINLFIKNMDKDEEAAQSSNDINLIDYSQYQLAFDSSETYSDLLTDSADPAYFPIYQINQQLVASIPVLKKSGDQELKQTSDSAVFDMYSAWDIDYSMGFFKSTSLKEQEENECEDQLLKPKSTNETVYSPSVPRKSLLPRLPSLPSLPTLPALPALPIFVRNNRESSDSSDSQDSEFNFTNTASGTTTSEPIEDSDDLNHIDYSKYQLIVLEPAESASSTSCTFISKKVDDPAYFPIYSLNKSLVKKVPITVSGCGNKVLESVEIPAVFDAFSHWDVTYSSDYTQAITLKSRHDLQLENKQLELNLEQEEERTTPEKQEKQQYPTIIDSLRALPNIRQFFPTITPQIEVNKVLPEEIEPAESDTAIFDSYSEWDTGYSSGFNESLRLKQTVEFEAENKLLEPAVINNEEHTDFSDSKPTIFDRLSALPNPLATLSVIKSKDEAPMKEFDITDNAMYELVISSSNSDAYCEYVALAEDPAYFPMYKMNASLVRQEPKEVSYKRKLCYSPNEAAVFDVYCPWDVEFTSGYGESVKRRACEIVRVENKALEQNVTVDYLNGPGQSRTVETKAQEGFGTKLFGIFYRCIGDKKNDRSTEAKKPSSTVQNKPKPKRQAEATAPRAVQRSDYAVETEMPILRIPSTPIERLLFSLSQRVNSTAITATANFPNNEPIIAPYVSPAEDINVLDRSEYELTVQLTEDSLYSDLLAQNEDIAYFPVYKLNEKLVKKVAKKEATLSNLKPLHNDMACFDAYGSEWDSIYTTDFMEALKLKSRQDFEAENELLKLQISETIKSNQSQASYAGFGTSLFKSIIRSNSKANILKKPIKYATSEMLEENNESIESAITKTRPASMMVKYQIQDSLTVRQPIEPLESIDQLTTGTTMDDLKPLIIDTYKLNYYAEMFEASTLTEISSVVQNSFFRASHIYQKSFVLKNNDSIQHQQTQEPALVPVQNLHKSKPYFDDFASFPSEHYEYSEYYLQSKSDKLSVGALSEQDKSHRSVSSLFGFVAITAGAISALLLRNA